MKDMVKKVGRKINSQSGKRCKVECAAGRGVYTPPADVLPEQINDYSQVIRICSEYVAEQRPKVRTIEDCINVLRPIIWSATRNKTTALFVVCLDQYRRVMCAPVEVAKGISNITMIHARDVFRVPIMTGACEIIVALNQIGGGTRFSQQDLELNSRLCAAGNLLGLRVVDFVLVGISRGRGIFSRDWESLSEVETYSEKGHFKF